MFPFALIGFQLYVVITKCGDSILILASAVFYYGSGSGEAQAAAASLFDAQDLIRGLVGPSMSWLFIWLS